MNGNMKNTILKELLKIKSKMIFENSLNIFSKLENVIEQKEMIEKDFLGKILIKLKKENEELLKNQEMYMNKIIKTLLNSDEEERMKKKNEEIKNKKKIKLEEEKKIKKEKIELEKRMKKLKEEQEIRRLNDIQLEKDLELEKKEDEENSIRLNLSIEKSKSIEKPKSIEKSKSIEKFQLDPDLNKNPKVIKNKAYLIEKKKIYLEKEKLILKNGYKKIKSSKDLKINIQIISFSNQKGFLKYFGPLDNLKGIFSFYF
jgi:hypothetical protein